MEETEEKWREGSGINEGLDVEIHTDKTKEK